MKLQTIKTHLFSCIFMPSFFFVNAFRTTTGNGSETWPYRYSLHSETSRDSRRDVMVEAVCFFTNIDASSSCCCLAEADVVGLLTASDVIEFQWS
jgi:hypothetical protein